MRGTTTRRSQRSKYCGGAKAGTPQGDRLDILATLIEAYETEHYPMDLPDPSEVAIRGPKTV